MNMDEDQKKKILIVDDDPFMQNLYRKALEREGFAILTALDGLAAVEMLPTLSVDLIVLDLMLPKIHGLKVLETIREDNLRKNLPVLILSNAYLPDVAQKAMNAKATAGILKSECSPKRLVKIIRDIFNTPADSKSPAATNSWFSSLLGGNARNSNQEARKASPPETAVAETATLSEVQDELKKSWPTDISAIRENCLKYVKTVGSQESEEHLKNIYRQLRLVSARATMGECSKISQLCNALEAMLFEHGFNLKRNMSPSVVQTMVQAVDCIEHLFKSGSLSAAPSARKTRVLLVDDDAVCNMVNDIALKRANFNTVCVAEGVAALALLENQSFDLIFLDVNMPVLSGFEVCEKLRKLPQCKDTPVIFVTLHGDFQSRAQGVLSGSNGFIAKPISPLELIVKALVFLQRSQGKETTVRPMPALKPAVVENTVPPAPQTSPVAEPKPEGRAKELEATKAAVEDKVKALTEALALEAKRREEAEQQAAMNAKLQSKLEAAQAENLKAHEWLQRLMEESEKQSQNGDTGQAWKADGRTRALEAVCSFVEDKVKNLAKDLAVETKLSEIAKAKVAEFAKRRSELEATLASVQQAKENLLREMESARSGEKRGELEAALAENQKSQSDLLRKLVEAQKEFLIQEQGQVTDQSLVEVRTKELQTAEAALAELKGQHAGVTTQVQSLTESLAAEAGRRTVAEKQAAELAARRVELEQELAQRAQTQEQLRAELAEYQQRLDAQIQNHHAELGNFNGRMKEFESAQAALAELKNQHAGVTAQVQSLSESLTAEAERRSTAEQKAAELTARRAELEQELAQRSQAQEQLRAELVTHEQLLDEQVQIHNAKLGNLEERTKELAAAQAAFAELKNQHASATAQVQSLSESLAAEASRRSTAEQLTAELIARRAQLEQELAQRSQTQEQLRTELAAREQLLNEQVQTHNAKLGNLEERTKELEAARAALAELKNQLADVTAQVQSLTESLAAEAARRTSAEQQTVELVARRTELEQELTQRSQTQEQLRTELATREQLLNEQVQTHNAKLGNLEERTKELEAARAALTELKSHNASVTSQVQSLTESLAAEASRRTAAEQQSAELVARRVELEQELARRSQTHEQLHAQLAEQQQRLDAQVQTYNLELGQFADRTRELEAAQAALAELKKQHASVTGQVQSLTQSLGNESGCRTAAEQKAEELEVRRAELEQQLAQRSKTNEQLCRELAESQQRLDAQVQVHNAELGNFSGRLKEFESAQASLVELKNQHADVSSQVQSLTKSLAAEADRRTTAEQKVTELVTRRAELEQELAQRSQTHEQLRAELADKQQQLDAQAQTHKAEFTHLAGQVKELESAQAALAELKNRHANVTSQVQSLTDSLAAEASHRVATEQKAAELDAHRAELAQELARRSQAHEQLRAELATQTQSRNLEHDQLAARTRELEAAQAILAALKSQHASVTAQVQSLTGSLAAEADRRTAAEQKVTELVTHRAELEQELARRSQTQEQLRAELAEQQQRLDTQVQAHNVEHGHLAERTKELETAQAALSELKNQHANVTAQVQSLTDSLAAETNRRTAVEQKTTELVAQRAKLEQELAQRLQAHEQLHTQLAGQQQQLETQIQAHKVDRDSLATRTKEWEDSQAALTELKSRHENVRTQVESLTKSLATEADHRTTAEQKVTELVARRVELEKELAQRSQAHEQLRAELAEKQQRLDAQAQVHHVELGNLAARTKELAAVQTTLAELRTEHQSVTSQVQQLTGSLNTESARRTTAEHQVAELLARRHELEEALAQHSQIGQQLRAELTGKKQQVDAVSAELENFRNQVTAGELRQKQMAEQIARSQQAEAELGEQLKATRDLSSTKEAALHALENELQKHRSEHDLLATRFQSESAQRRRLETQLENIQSQLNDASSRLAQKCADEQVWLGHESEFQIRIRDQQAEIEKSNVALAARADEIKRSREQIEELRVTQSALCVKVQTITEQSQTLTESLATESGRRAIIEQKAAEMSSRRTELEQELAQSIRAREALRAELDTQIQTYNLELNRLAERTKELEIVQAALAEWKARHAAAEQAWTRLESELQSRIHTQQDQLSKTGAALTTRENEIKNAREKIEELHVLQSALCAKVQALTNQGESAAKEIQEWQTKAVRSENTVENIQRKLAGLNYSILDASRLSTRLHRERSQQEQQTLAALQQQLASLAQTPLSLTQRGLLTDLQNAMDGLKKNRGAATGIETFRVELPGLRASHFCFAEVSANIFRAVQAAASAAGVAVQVATAGLTTAELFGFAEHIHQLIILLATSPLHMVKDVNALDLRLEIEPQNMTLVKMTVRVTLSLARPAQDFLARLDSVTTAAATLQSGEFTEAEFGLAAGWQLAQAMGAQADIQAVGNQGVRLTLSLPVEIESALSTAEDPADRLAAPNGNPGRNGHSHTAKKVSRNGNHQHHQPEEPLMAVENK
jgi:DNA-binding response OmpR family regulator/chromosome segregation ATPase